MNICPLPVKAPSHLPPFPTPLGCYRAPVWVPWVTNYLITYYVPSLCPYQSYLVTPAAVSHTHLQPAQYNFLNARERDWVSASKCPGINVSMCCPLLLQSPSKQNKDGAVAVVAVVTLSGSCLTLLSGWSASPCPRREDSCSLHWTACKKENSRLRDRPHRFIHKRGKPKTSKAQMKKQQQEKDYI